MNLLDKDVPSEWAKDLYKKMEPHLPKSYKLMRRDLLEDMKAGCEIATTGDHVSITLLGPGSMQRRWSIAYNMAERSYVFAKHNLEKNTITRMTLKKIRRRTASIITGSISSSVQ